MFNLNSKALSLAMLVFSTLGIVFSSYAQEEQAHCHVYIGQSGWTGSGVDHLIRVEYSSSNLCESILSGYPCFSYFESKEGCTKSDQSLIDLFKKDARASGQLID